MLFSYKIFTLFQPFSQLPNKFYIRKSPPPTHHHPQKIHHYPHKTHHHHTTQKPPKRHHPHHHNNNKKIRDQANRRESDRRESRSAREWLAIKQIEDDQTRFKREREIEKERDRWCKLRTRWPELDGAISPLRLDLGRDLAHSPYSLFFLSLSLSFCVSVSPFSLSFSLCASMFSRRGLKVK